MHPCSSLKRAKAQFRSEIFRTLEAFWACRDASRLAALARARRWGRGKWKNKKGTIRGSGIAGTLLKESGGWLCVEAAKEMVACFCPEGSQDPPVRFHGRETPNDGN